MQYNMFFPNLKVESFKNFTYTEIYSHTILYTIILSLLNVNAERVVAQRMYNVNGWL